MAPKRSILSTGTIPGSVTVMQPSTGNAQDLNRATTVQTPVCFLQSRARGIPRIYWTCPLHQSTITLINFPLLYQYLSNLKTKNRRPHLTLSSVPYVMKDIVTWLIAYYAWKRKNTPKSKSREILWLDWNALKRRSKLLRFQTNQPSMP